MKKNKVALLFHGVVGSKNRHGKIVNYGRALKTHYNNLYNNETCDIDVFMHYWDMDNNISDSKLIRDFKPTRYIKKKTIDKGIGEEYWKILNKSYKKFNGNFRNKKNIINILERIYSQMYGLFYCNELKRNYEIEHNFKYDFVIKTRYDLLLGWKPNFNSLDPKKFYSLPYNKQKKIHKGKDYITLTDFFWISGTEIMDDFVKIAPNFKDYLENEDFVNYFSGKLEYAWIWNMINYNIYDKIELQDFLENPISLDRFLDKNVEFHRILLKTRLVVYHSQVGKPTRLIAEKK